MHRILVIDDEPALRLMLREALETVGYEVEEAQNGAEGLSLHRRWPFHLIITDIFMPGTDGLEVIKELREQGDSIPVLAISGGGLFRAEDALTAARKVGASEVLQKPFALQQILWSVESALRAVA
jgi:DNA-binding response OmpR family regulator